MENGEILLLFSEENPFWTEDLVRLAGEDCSVLRELREDGYLVEEKGVFSLTGKGRTAFAAEAAENFLSSVPAAPGHCAGKSLFRTRLRLLLDGKHLQRWGLKEYIGGARFAIPPLEDRDIFSMERGLEWTWPSSPLMKRMTEDFPRTGLAARGNEVHPPCGVEAWVASLGLIPGFFVADLLFLSRYDYLCYEGFSPHPRDRWGLVNADRFFCLQWPPVDGGSGLERIFSAIGRFHLCMESLRRAVIPGYVDLDCLDQDCINWLVFVFRKEEDAGRAASLMEDCGEDLAGPAAPMEIWTLGLDSLEGFPGKAENIHDLLPVTAHPVVRVK